MSTFEDDEKREVGLVPTANDSAYLASFLGTQLNRMRGRARYYRSQAGANTSNRPETEAAEAEAEAELMIVKRILEKLKDKELPPVTIRL